ncbi:Syd protein [Streptomyces sp. NBRC 110611]|uniref:DUF397 domain-containing protein n=1 Tax=Streptomyces sp. NBRC 110611 TaxID=1621259 RepID=UPI00082CAE47|nr:DUF397 domain-containing protein [Streptomyces sp. NBRC 110611]GAU65214.1 Syd protein [Streptomyces sp. NBRC 110611]
MRTTPDLSTAVWRKSSYSNADGGECVEVAEGFPGAAQWRKSSYSNNDGGVCVEVADGLPGLVPVRDSKNPHGPVLLIPGRAWAAFVAGVRAGDLGV